VKLFPSEEDALEFLEDYELDEARIKLLKALNRIPEAAEIHIKNGNVLKAVEMLTASAVRNVDHVRPTIEHLLTALWRGLTLGVPPADNPIVSKLLALADRLNKSTMTEQEVNEVGSSSPSNRRVSCSSTYSLLCSKQSNILTMGTSVHSLRPSLGRRTTLPLCCVWTTPFPPLSICEISRSLRSRPCSPFTSTTSVY